MPALEAILKLSRMKLVNRFEVKLPLQEAWAVLLDVPRVARCLPGAELVAPVDAETYRGKIAVRLGPVNLSFSGTARFAEIDETQRRVTIKAKGSEEKGRGGAEATAEMTLAEASPGASLVTVMTDLALHGAVAQYGRGAAMIEGVAQELVDRFAANLKVEILGSEAEREAARERARRGVSVFGLFFAALWRWVRRHFAAEAKGAIR